MAGLKRALIGLVLAGCATAPPQAPAPSQPQDQPRPEVPAKAPADAPHAEPYIVLGGWLLVSTAAFIVARRITYGPGRLE